MITEQVSAPQDSTNTLIWKWDSYSDRFVYHSLTPGLAISTRVSEPVMQDFFAQLQKIPNYSMKKMAKIRGFSICFFILTFVILQILIMTNVIPVLGDDYYIWIVVGMMAFMMLGIFVTICLGVKAYKNRKIALDLACQNFTISRLRPYYPACSLTCSQFVGYLMLNDPTLQLAGVNIVEPVPVYNMPPQNIPINVINMPPQNVQVNPAMYPQNQPGYFQPNQQAYQINQP